MRDIVRWTQSTGNDHLTESDVAAIIGIVPDVLPSDLRGAEEDLSALRKSLRKAADAPGTHCSALPGLAAAMAKTVEASISLKRLRMDCEAHAHNREVLAEQARRRAGRGR